MSKARWIALAGPLTILVGSLWLAAALADFVLRSGLSIEETFLGFAILPLFLSFIPLLLALIGTRLRFYRSASLLGRLGLALSVAGCTGLILSLLATILLGGAAPQVGQPPWLSYLALACLLSIRIGYILFGVDALRYRLLPRWNWSPLLLGLTVVFSFGFDWFGVPAILPEQLAAPFLHFFISGLCWVLLGVALVTPVSAASASPPS